MRAFVTGGNGFVGRYLVAELRARGIETVAAGHGSAGAPYDVPIDLDDAAGLARAIADARPDAIFHLAAQAFVPQSIEAPLETYDVNVMGTARTIDALRPIVAERRIRFVFVSSAEVYGAQASDAYPLRETVVPRPANPYAASKLAGEALVLASAQTYGFDAIVTRAFNHIGPGQNERFAVAAFAQRLARIAAGGPPLFPVGNLETRRDFLDVRDVVRAYVDLAERGTPGETYNVCSGTATSMTEVLRALVMAARVGVEIREDPALVRRVDVPRVFGDNAKLVAATGWKPAYNLAQSLREVYADARAAAATAAG